MSADTPADLPAYPQPRETPVNRPFLEAWRDEGVLLVQRCEDCRHVYFYPRPFCTRCFSDDVGWLTTRGLGTVLAFTCVHRPNHPSFFDEVPIVLAEVALPEGTTLLTRVVGDNRTDITAGAALKLVSGEVRRRYPLPTFKLAEETP